MKVSITDNLEEFGFTEVEVASMVADAEAGVGFPDRLGNPVAEFFLSLPQQTRAAIVAQAEESGKSIAEVLVDAVTDHFAA